MKTAPDFSLTHRGGNRYALSGRVSFANAARLHGAFMQALATSDSRQTFTLELAALNQLDTALLALLLELRAQTAARRQALALDDPPPALYALARLSEVQDLLPLTVTAGDG